MPDETPIYDLMLLLATSAEEERRAKILADVEAAIAGASGSIVHKSDWGARALAYRIDHQADAEYHLLQFTGPVTLLESLNHTLGITDGVVRFRIIKVLPGTPPPRTPERAVPAAATASTGGAATTGGPSAAGSATATTEQAPSAESVSSAEPAPSAESVSSAEPAPSAESVSSAEQAPSAEPAPPGAPDEPEPGE